MATRPLTKKRFGQHFLQHPGVIQQLVTAIDPQPQDLIVEIGPGLGALTYQLLPFCQQLHVVEIDRDLILPLQQQAQSSRHFTIHHADALQFDISSLSTGPASIRLVGNLPYNIGTTLLFHWFEQLSVIKDMHFMLQKEVVDRMAAQPEQAAYGRLSVMTQYFCAVQPLFEVAPSAFQPPPKVNSAVVRLRPHSEPSVACHDFALFEQVVKQAFSQRRKMLRNTLKNWVNAAQFEQLNIDPQARAESLSLNDYICLSNFLKEHQ